MSENTTTKNTTTTWLDDVLWNDKGLVPAIAQDEISLEILMVAWMNREALTLSLEENRAVYWSRSRQKLWRKGEESGHVQNISEIRLDCDNDVILLKIKQIGDIACHTGRRSCFYKKLENGQWHVKEPVLKDPNTIYQKPA